MNYKLSKKIIVLVIDDSIHEQLFLSRTLPALIDCEILLAKDGEEGLEKISEENPDVVFLDIAMPGIDGITVLETIRTNLPQYKNPIIALTAISDEFTITRLNSLGIQDFLIKPVNIQKIVDKLQKLFPLID